VSGSRRPIVLAGNHDRRDHAFSGFEAPHVQTGGMSSATTETMVKTVVRLTGRVLLLQPGKGRAKLFGKGRHHRSSLKRAQLLVVAVRCGQRDCQQPKAAPRAARASVRACAKFAVLAETTTPRASPPTWRPFIRFRKSHHQPECVMDLPPPPTVRCQTGLTSLRH
jgi:hypothetical protein